MGKNQPTKFLEAVFFCGFSPSISRFFVSVISQGDFFDIHLETAHIELTVGRHWITGYQKTGATMIGAWDSYNMHSNVTSNVYNTCIIMMLVKIDGIKSITTVCFVWIPFLKFILAEIYNNNSPI